MSARRILAAAAVVLIAVLCTPAALAPVVNSADFIVAAAGPALIAIVIWPRTQRNALPWVADIDETHPEALSRLDRLDGVGSRRASTPQTPAGGAEPPSHTDAPHVDAPPAGPLS